MDRLHDKIAIVTGGARGMGAETVRAFVNQGARVVIADVLVHEGQALADELGDAAIFHTTDVAHAAEWMALLAVTHDRFGAPDVLINNAAVMRFTSILDCDVDDFRSVLDINLVGTFLGLKIVGGDMVRRRRGAIVNISSVDGMRGANGYAAYSASKWGVRGLTKVAAMEFGPRGVRVNSVHPGGVYTAMGNPTGAPVEAIDDGFGLVPLQRTGRPHEVAMASLFLASDEASYICGAELAVDGGWTTGIYTVLSGGPDDSDYGNRSGVHDLSAQFDAALAAQSGSAR
ncbi:glucose 1-dehydrogenase [Novosphingobium sp.]|uniref:SDR family NAD(P)-dependent oxidoreductase n=1 Tax=Novosphingobium sp. TaxID=1874826 RepID=UPI00333F022C